MLVPKTPTHGSITTSKWKAQVTVCHCPKSWWQPMPLLHCGIGNDEGHGGKSVETKRCCDLWMACCEWEKGGKPPWCGWRPFVESRLIECYDTLGLHNLATWRQFLGHGANNPMANGHSYYFANGQHHVISKKVPPLYPLPQPILRWKMVTYQPKKEWPH